MNAPPCPHGSTAPDCPQCTPGRAGVDDADFLGATHLSGPRPIPSALQAAQPVVARTVSPSAAGTITPGGGSPADPPLERGTAVGRYLVLEVLGQGGMGRVYAAYDPELERKVAIKLLRAAGGGSTDTGGHVRLLREAQAMARLNHPNVVGVHDVGLFAHSVFVAMELVEGETLAEWLTARKRTWREVLPLFVAAGRGLAAAHAAGLIHRDFKPANVLMGGDGRVRVTDFGLARSQVQEEVAPSAQPPSGLPVRAGTSLSQQMTLAGSVMGTPGYMAPEQLVGEAATAQTDQFNFAASLYEALFGQVPFRGASLGELVRAVTQGPPAPPEGSHVPMWLQKVVLRALRPAPAERYPSLEALLEELARDRDGQRRRWAMRGAVAAVIALTAAAGVVRSREPSPCAGAERRLETVWTPQLRAQTQAAFLATGKPFAPVVFQQAASMLEAYRDQWIAGHREACEATRVRNEQTEADLALRFDCLEGSRRDLDALGRLLSTADETLMTNAVRAASALPPLERCANLKELRQPVPPPATAADRERLEQARITLAQARALVQAGRSKDARPLLEPLLKLGDDPGFRPFYAEVLLQSAELSRGEASVGAYLEAARMAELAHSDTLRARALLEVARSVGYKLRRPAESEPFVTLANAVVERAGNDPLLRARRDQAIADIEWTRGKYDAAIAGYRSALELRRAVLGERHEHVASSMYDVGWVLMEQRDWDAARELLTAAHQMRVELLGEEHPNTLASLNSLAALASASDEYEAALAMLEKMMRAGERYYAPDSENVASAINNLALTYQLAGQPERAVEPARKARAIYEKLFGKDSPNVVTPIATEAMALGDLGRPDEAMVLVNEALRLVRKTGNALQECDLLQYTALLQSDKKRHAVAIAAAKDAVKKCEATQGADPGMLARARQHHGEVLLAAGDRAGAAALLETALKQLEQLGRPVELANLRFDLARALGNRGKDAERALSLARTARDTFAQKKRAKDLQKVDAWLAAAAAL